MNYKEELRNLEVEFMHGVPVKLPEEAITSISALFIKLIEEQDTMPRFYLDNNDKQIWVTYIDKDELINTIRGNK